MKCLRTSRSLLCLMLPDMFKSLPLLLLSLLLLTLTTADCMDYTTGWWTTRQSWKNAGAPGSVKGRTEWTNIRNFNFDSGSPPSWALGPGLEEGAPSSGAAGGQGGGAESGEQVWGPLAEMPHRGDVCMPRGRRDKRVHVALPYWSHGIPCTSLFVMRAVFG